MLTFFTLILHAFLSGCDDALMFSVRFHLPLSDLSSMTCINFFSPNIGPALHASAVPFNHIRFTKEPVNHFHVLLQSPRRDTFLFSIQLPSFAMYCRLFF